MIFCLLSDNARGRWRGVCKHSHKGPFIYSIFNFLFNSRNTVWLGINDWDVENVWVWSDKSAVTFTAWNRGEPNNYNNEDCAMIVQNGKWVDINCFSKQLVICKRLMGNIYYLCT